MRMVKREGACALEPPRICRIARCRHRVVTVTSPRLWTLFRCLGSAFVGATVLVVGSVSAADAAMSTGAGGGVIVHLDNLLRSLFMELTH